jgi:phenylacetate-CoA ligase
MMLIENMKNLDLYLNYNLKAIFLISENFTLKELIYIKNYFKCEVSSFFGHTERLVFAPLDKLSNSAYQVDKRYGFLELINKDNQEHEIVGTSFDNFAMPLIRYKTGDNTSYKNEKKQLLNLIDGRWEKEYLNGKDGLNLTLTALNMHSNIFKNVINFQFYQTKIGEVQLLIIPNKYYSQNDTDNILNALNKKVGQALGFKIKIISSPLLTKRGKLKKLIKEIHD